MRLPLWENISGKEQWQLLARIVGSELLVHALAPAGRHIRQETEATSCEDSWLRMVAKLRAPGIPVCFTLSAMTSGVLP